MLDLFTIFSKGGIVLWCFQGTAQSLAISVNTLIKSVILQERGGLDSFTHDALKMKYKLDNEFELVFVVAYQKFLQLSYVDKFLNDIQIEFRNRYKDELYKGEICLNLDGFQSHFLQKLREVEDAVKGEMRKMRTFDESQKSQKTVASMIESKKSEPPKKNNIKAAKNATQNVSAVEKIKSVASDDDSKAVNVQENLKKLQEKLLKANKNDKKPAEKKQEPKKGKQNREWLNSGKNTQEFDYSETNSNSQQQIVAEHYESMKGELKGLDEGNESEFIEEIAEDQKGSSKGSAFGFFGSLRSLVGSKVLTKEDVRGAIEKMKDHLIAKNVAAEIAANICDSIVTKLEGKVLGTFKTVASTVRQSLEESCIQLLTPHKRIDILRDALEAKHKKLPFVIVFCGVNGVGKSTNLAKIAYWLIENDLRVLIAACDTFRAGAVEQLRTHCLKLNSTRTGEPMVQLYEKGYGKDAAGVAMEAIGHARDAQFDVVMVDTAGRTQGNEPLMRSLAKLIKVNQPNLVLFVGEALVGNDAVDQLVKFNQALADYSNMENPHLIDGIVLTKFDTIDDKVGAAISMTFITGQPIVFVGTGQTYSDLKVLNARSVVNSLMKA